MFSSIVFRLRQSRPSDGGRCAGAAAPRNAGTRQRLQPRSRDRRERPKKAALRRKWRKGMLDRMATADSRAALLPT